MRFCLQFCPAGGLQTAEGLTAAYAAAAGFPATGLEYGRSSDVNDSNSKCAAEPMGFSAGLTSQFLAGPYAAGQTDLSLTFSNADLTR